MKGKRGFLLGEYTVKIVISVLCILVLVVLGVMLYSTYSGNQWDEQAKITLEEIESKISSLEDGQETTYIARYPYAIMQVFDSNFLCICEVGQTDCKLKYPCKEFQKEILIDTKYVAGGGVSELYYKIFGWTPALIEHIIIIQEDSTTEIKIKQENKKITLS